MATNDEAKILRIVDGDKIKKYNSLSEKLTEILFDLGVDSYEPVYALSKCFKDHKDLLLNTYKATLAESSIIYDDLLCNYVYSNNIYSDTDKYSVLITALASMLYHADHSIRTTYNYVPLLNSDQLFKNFKWDDAQDRKVILCSTNKKTGICFNLGTTLDNVWIPKQDSNPLNTKEMLRSIFQFWEHFSGSPLYPVPPSLDNKNDVPLRSRVLFSKGYMERNFWEGAYGDARKSLCRFVLKNVIYFYMLELELNPKDFKKSEIVGDQND